MCNLLEALECEDDNVILEAFMERYNVTKEDALDVFTETKKWLWLAANASQTKEQRLFIDTPLTIIDEMWHNFLLHTKLYYDYCMSKFNRIIHHIPSSHMEKRENLKKIALEPDDFETMIKNQYKIIYDNLGPETLVKWYDTLASKYTPEYIQSIKKF